jgi:type VI secretion system ImpM family protein
MDTQLKKGFFGKLPHYPDFIKYNASSNEVIDFDEWIQQGLTVAKERLQNEWSDAYRSAPIYCFLFPSDDQQNILMGVMRSSNDLSGRKYPFIALLKITLTELPAHSAYHLPIIYHDFLNKSEIFVKIADGIDKLEYLSDQFDHMDLSAENEVESLIDQYDQFLLHTTQEEFWYQIGTTFDDSTRYLVLKNLNDILLPFRDQNIEGFALGLRFPLSNGNKYHFETAFWIHTSMQICNNFKLTPFVFWTAQVPSCVLFFKKPSASEYTSLIKPDISWDSIYVMNSDGNREDLIDNFADKYKSLLQIPDLPLSDFLQELKTIQVEKQA